MPYQDMPDVFVAPENPDTAIWRYMTLAKFISMLDAKALFFSRADRMRDRFEGSLSTVNVAAHSELLAETLRDFRQENPELFALTSNVSSQANRDMVPHMFLNCWHQNDHESAAMWDLYSQQGVGIAIRSTFARFCMALDKAERPIYVGRVQYIDYGRDWMPQTNFFYPFTHKRMSYAHERELRAVMLIYDGPDVPLPDFGLNVECELTALIEGIYVSPESPSWFTDVVRSVTGKYGLKIEITQSDLARDPVY